jgi:hypothetical protein
MRTLADILAEFEACTTPFDADAVSYPLWELKRVTEAAGNVMPADLHAEWLAFAVQPTRRWPEDESKSKWGTYYGPVGGFPGPNGFVDVPTIDDVTDAMVMYWDGRARAARHPVLRVRYADMAWDLGREQAVKVSHELPRIVIDETIACADRKIFEHSTQAFAGLQRALGLALSLKDEKRAATVADAMVAYEDHIAEDHLAGTWGFAFEALVTNRHGRLVLDDAVTNKILADMEARLARLAGPTPDPKTITQAWGMQRAALALAQHYQHLEQPEDVRRVLRLYGRELLDITTRTMATLAMAWLEPLFHIYRGFGLSRDAEAVAKRIRQLGPDAIKEMKSISHEIEIPAVEVEQFLTAMMAGTLNDSLVRVAQQFVPVKAQLHDHVKRMPQVAPIASMFGVKTMDVTGRPVAAIGSVEDDVDGRVIEQATRMLQLDSSWLRWTVDRLVSTFKPTSADLRDHILRAPIFDGRGAVIERGLTAYLEGDAVAAVPILIPQIEHAIRTLFESAGGSLLKWHRSGGWMLKNLDDLLRDPIVTTVFGESVVQYLRVLFTEQRGWNLRNDVCHGITPPEHFTIVMADRVFHALLLLALVRETSTTTGAPPDPAAQDGGPSRGDE